MSTHVLPVIGIFVIHPHEVFLKAVYLGLATDDPVVVHDHAVRAVFFWRKDAVSFLEVVHATQVPVNDDDNIYSSLPGDKLHVFVADGTAPRCGNQFYVAHKHAQACKPKRKWTQ